MDNPIQLFIELIISAIAVLITSYLLPGVTVHNFFAALVVAGVLSLLNTFIKPLLIILTIPLTIFTFGLFILVINAFIVILAGEIVPGFVVQGFWWAVFFGIILSFVMSLFRGLARQYQR